MIIITASAIITPSPTTISSSSIVTTGPSGTVAPRSFGSRTTLRLHPSFGLRHQGSLGKSHFSTLGIYFKKFNIHFISYFKDILYLLYFFVIKLGYMKKALFAGKNFHKSSKFQYRNYFS